MLKIVCSVLNGDYAPGGKTLRPSPDHLMTIGELKSPRRQK